MMTAHACGNSGVGFSAGGVANCMIRMSRINSAGLFFGGSLVCDIAVRHPTIRKAMNRTGRIVWLNSDRYSSLTHGNPPPRAKGIKNPMLIRGGAAAPPYQGGGAELSLAME